MSESLQLARGWSLRVISHGAHSIVGEVQLGGVTHADLLGTTRRGDVAQAELRLRPGVPFQLAGSVGGFNLREVAELAGISPSDDPRGKSGDEILALDLEILAALQNALAQYLGGPVAVTPFHSDSDEPLVIFDMVNDVRPNRPTS
jgi:hypothetical protein